MNRIEYDWSERMPTGDNATFQVTAHLYVDGIQTLASVQRLSISPKRGDRHPHETNMFVQAVEFVPVSDGYWRADITYGNREVYTDSTEMDYPWRRNPEIRYSPEFVQIVAQKHYKDDKAKKAEVPILNSAGDMFINPPVMVRMRLKIEITWWTRTFNDKWINTYWNTINMNQVILDGRLYQEKTLWLTLLLPNPFYSTSGSRGFQVSAEIAHDPEGFNYKVLQAGYNAKRSTDGKRLPVRIDNQNEKYTFEEVGEKISDPILLKANGTLLTESLTEMAEAQNPVYTDMRYLPLADWKGLGIPELKANIKKFGA